LYIPCPEQGTNCLLIPTQNEDIEILVLARLSPQEKIDSPAGRDPPRNP
jgi:hypothetical protein